MSAVRAAAVVGEASTVFVAEAFVAGLDDDEVSPFWSAVSLAWADVTVAWAESTEACSELVSSDARVCPAVTFCPTATPMLTDRPGDAEIEVGLVTGVRVPTESRVLHGVPVAGRGSR